MTRPVDPPAVGWIREIDYRQRLRRLELALAEAEKRADELERRVVELEKEVEREAAFADDVIDQIGGTL